MEKVPKERALYRQGELSGTVFSPDPRAYDGDCYTFNEGGMDEVQWSIGINQKRLRVGLGFHMDFHPAFPNGSNIKKVSAGLKAMQEVIHRTRSAFEKFVMNGALDGMIRLEVYGDAPRRGQDIVDFFDKNVQDYSWVCLAIYIQRSRECLKEPKNLDTILKQTRDAFWDYYCWALAGCYGAFNPPPIVRKKLPSGTIV